MRQEFVKLVKSIDKHYQWADDFTVWRENSDRDKKAQRMIRDIKTDSVRQEYRKFFCEHMGYKV